MSQNFYYPPSAAGSSTVTANQGTPNTLANAWPVKITDGTDFALVSAAGELQVNATALPLPAGAATSGNQVSEIALLLDISHSLPTTLGAKLTAASMAVNIASDQTVPVVVAAGSNIIGRVGIDQTTPGTTNGVQINAALPAGANAIGSVSVSNFPATQPVSGTVTINALTNSSVVKAQLQDNAGTAIVLGQTTMSASVPVTLASNQSALAVTSASETASTATLSNVSGSASSVQILAATARKGMMLFNDSTAALYLKFGTTASTSSFTVLVPSQAYYEMPASSAVYVGRIDGIWAAANGSARITELS